MRHDHERTTLSEKSLPLARSIAEATGAQLHLAHVHEHHEPQDPGLSKTHGTVGSSSSRGYRALEHYELAIEAHPRGNEDAILRWNACVRMIDRHADCAPDPGKHVELGLE